MTNGRIERTPFNIDIVDRLVPAFLSLRANRAPDAWQVRLCKAIVFGDLVPMREPDDPGLAEVVSVASGIKIVIANAPSR